MRHIDLRSDTVTKPTEEMRAAMAAAEVGDDVYGEDPTVNKLQEMAAVKMGHEGSLFVASGTMGNLIAILSHCERGDEVIVGNKAHTFLYEGGGLSALGGIHSCQLHNEPDGSIDMSNLEGAIRDDDPHEPISRLVCLENTHNRCGGTYQTPEYTRKVVEFSHTHGLYVHLDGARIFNAAVAQGIDVQELSKPVDSIMFCLSKGLCAPVGSLLCGSRKFIKKAHRIRKMLGGGMRQVGILAAAGIIALETMTSRLNRDHEKARRLADGLIAINGLHFKTPMTNMVFLTVDETVACSIVQLVDFLQCKGILVGITGQRSLRLVLHYWIDDADIEYTVSTFQEVFSSLPRI
jgi:threonine aldolase